MSISVSNNPVDEYGHEIVEYGSAAFPVACYQGDFSLRDVPWHWHEELEAVVILSGSCTVTFGNRRHTLHAGEGFFINAGVLHGVTLADAGQCHFRTIIFNSRLVSGSPDSVFSKNYVSPLIHDMSLEGMVFSPDTDWQLNALDAIRSAWQACEGDEAGFEFRVRTHLSELIFLLHTNHTERDIPADSGSVRSSGRIKQMLQFIHDNYGEDLNIARIAGSAAISSSECLRCFKSTIGISPIQYLKQYRLQQACQLLVTTMMPISDIAKLCGFNDMSYFTKTFRESKGKTPGDYRRSQK